MNKGDYKEQIEQRLSQYLNTEDRQYKEKLYEAMEYSLMAGGKRIRPWLTLAFCSLCGGNTEEAMPFACGVEMIHTYSLIHDDLPAMDNDDMRRGRPTNHIVYGEDIALLAGDGLLTKAFEIMLTGAKNEKAIKAAAVMAKYAGTFGMIGGQCIDLQAEGKKISLKELEAMDMGKTVGLIRAACLMGAIIGGGDEACLLAASDYAEGVGMAFQIRDDILDVVGDSAALGKNTGMDAQLEKSNYVSLLGLERAEALVHEYTQKALAALGEFTGDITPLREFALSMQNRTV